jgi:hypothetical protein
MAVASFICLFILIQHLQTLIKAQDYDKSIDKNFLYSILLNLCTLLVGAACFGKLYSPSFLYSFSLFIVAIVYGRRRALVEWMESIANQHWIKTKSKK